uniref:Uncharacterized protein n=1 Tax=Amphimedon queenslandica TaxID=400682 RepID=A0A1X7VBN4_AMPQE
MLLRKLERGSSSSISPEKELLQLCLKYASDSPVFKFCPGINATEYELTKRPIRFDVKRSGSRGNKWSMVTIRMALAVCVRSPAAYEALKSVGVLQLPC